MTTPCSWWEPTGRSLLRVGVDCPNGHYTQVEAGWIDSTEMPKRVLQDASLPWPRTCASCGVDITVSEHRTAGLGREWGCPATGETTRVLPPGALYDAYWYADWRTGLDGRALCCVLPNGHHWFIDGRASNCGDPEDKEHRCWCRHGDPTQPQSLTVDKQPPPATCTAGAGSIAAGNYHGFLQNGVLT